MNMISWKFFGRITNLKFLRALARVAQSTTCRLSLTLACSSSTKWVAGKQATMRTSTSHSRSRLLHCFLLLPLYTQEEEKVFVWLMRFNLWKIVGGRAIHQGEHWQAADIPRWFKNQSHLRRCPLRWSHKSHRLLRCRARFRASMGLWPSAIHGQGQTFEYVNALLNSIFVLTTFSEKCEVARYRAIIKKHSDQHEYELGKYTMELLRQVKFT